MRWEALAAGLVVIGILPVPATALETDQFYAWTRPLSDASDAINAHINADLSEVLARVDAHHDPKTCTCRTVQRAIRSHFDYGVIARPELWATKTSLLDRVPATPEEEPRFRHAYLYGKTSPLDPVRWMPPSPTIEIAGIRIGADKLGHFFSDGAWTEESYRRALKNGASEDDAVGQAVRYSIATERTIWGEGTSGIMSLGDLEANFQGLLFYRGLCGGEHPMLKHAPDGWRLERPFDIRDYVSPKWDESWEPNVYTRYRWAKVKPVMLRYCALLQDPEVRRRRTAYAALDRETPTAAIVRQLVASGRMADPRQFGIEAVCGVAPSEAPRDSGR